MKTEIEAKFLNINKDKIREALKSIGATLKQPEVLTKRKNFDFADRRLRKNDHAWLRVRDEGAGHVTLSYKKKEGEDIHGVKELLVNVSNFDDVCAILKLIGLEEKNFQETYRESWTLGTTQIDIDTWPWIPPLIEIEGETEEDVKSVAKSLGLDWSHAKFGSALTAFQEVFNIGEELHEHPKITFNTDAPAEWRRIRG